MMEFPESHTLARQMTEAFGGKRVRSVVAGASPHGLTFFNVALPQFDQRLRGTSWDGAAAYGGQLEMRMGEERLTFNDGINPRLLSPDARPPAKHQFHLVFEDGTAMVCTVQMYGGIQLYRAGENDNPYYLVAREKPSPLSEAFDAAYFDALFAGLKPTLSAKAFLATEQRIPGLGNGVLQDILFLSHLHPKRKLSTLSDADKQAMFDAVKSTLGRMTTEGGRDVEKDLHGRPGGYHTLLSSKTWRQPCPVCGGEIQRQAYLGGNVYFCAACQPL